MPSKQFTERITINCTAEQKRAFKAARNEAGDGLSDNQALHALLAEYCASHGIAWPEAESVNEGRNWIRGKGGKFEPKS